MTDRITQLECQLAEARAALEWFCNNLRVKKEDGTGTQYGRASLWEGPENAQMCLCMAANSYSLASLAAIEGALQRAGAAIRGEPT